jgi:Sigma-70, region 4
MASLDSLPPDQRAVLELVLRSGRTYDEIAALLSIDRAGVRERALAALDALGPRTSVAPERRALITDYLLGALPGRVADDVRDHLAGSPSERAWTRVVASELQGIASGPLPEIPVEPGLRDHAPEPAAVEAAEAPEQRPERPARRPPAPRARPAKPSGPRTSRTGGALLLAGGAAIVVAVVLVLVLSGGGSKKPATSASAGAARTPTSGSTASTPATSGTNPQVVAQINLNPPSGGAAKGIAEVLREQGKTGIAIVAQGLSPNTKKPPNAYAVWLYNSPTDSRILGFVNPGVGSNGRLQTAGGLPTNASHFQKLLVTLETQSNPKAPGTIVLEGPLTGV